jgi:hypothetical protein
MAQPKNFAEFWPEYLVAHSAPATRALHYLGSTLAVVCLVLAAIGGDWRWLVAAPIAGYAFAFIAHFTIEGNNPKTFEHPLWSLMADYRMLGLWMSGRLQAELSRARA